MCCRSDPGFRIYIGSGGPNRHSHPATPGDRSAFTQRRGRAIFVSCLLSDIHGCSSTTWFFHRPDDLNRYGGVVVPRLDIPYARCHLEPTRQLEFTSKKNNKPVVMVSPSNLTVIWPTQCMLVFGGLLPAVRRC